MFTRQIQKGQSLSYKNIHIPQLLPRNHQKGTCKSIKKQINDNLEYGTDEKKPNHINQLEPTEMNDIKSIINSCPNCRNKISQFVTKKHHHHERWTQTTTKPFLIDLIQEKVSSICEENSRLAQSMREKDNELLDREQQINEVQDKLTSILYSVGQDLQVYKLKANDIYEVRNNIMSDTDTPSYIKALLYDRN